MAGHSKFKNIQHRKGAQDKKRAKLFARFLREVSVAARDGENPDFNARLRTALSQARNNNVPRDNIERAIKKAQEVENLEHITYAGYGPSGVAVVVECTTDNHRRTASSVRACFSRLGYELVERNAVLFQFKRLSYIDVPKERIVGELALLEFAEALQASEILEEEDAHRFLCETNIFSESRDKCDSLLENNMAGVVSGLLWHPHTCVQLDNADCEKLQKLVQILEDADCVDDVFTNAE
ncbi:MAG: YebC/PmpR family DNA-binding transcriptional regulator [Alphaproteobacteria bacterium]|nr:YebC/PmpR family DNA-binding transcriptional regulator [Alphaproteobacteria bacterium]